MEKVFKVLSKEGSKLFSANSWVKQEYFLVKVNFPKFKDSKIFIFPDVERCVRFYEEELSYMDNIVIYESLAENVQVKGLNILDIWRYKDKPEEIEHYWKDGAAYYTRKVPRGTLVCSSLYLLKQVDKRKLYGYK